MKQILNVTHVTKYYGTKEVITKALDDLTMTICDGEFMAIMGASGSGKSTLLNVIASIDRVSAGQILVDGENIVKLKDKKLAAYRRDRLGFIFQDYNLLDTLTVGENIALPLNLKKVGVKETEKRLQKVADTLDLTSQLRKFPAELSGGQRQRVACARALITEPALVLADEPTGALDSVNSGRLMSVFSMMNEQLHATILMVTHDAVVGSFASRILFLKDGRIWNELIRGNRDRQTMYHEILNVMASMGGEADVR